MLPLIIGLSGCMRQEPQSAQQPTATAPGTNQTSFWNTVTQQQTQKAPATKAAAPKTIPVQTTAPQISDSGLSLKALNQRGHSADELLNFDVENTSKKDAYITCFAYLKKDLALRWRWDKSPVQKVMPGQKATVEVDFVPDSEDREEVYGVLAVFDTQQEAEDATYELLPDEAKLDLDLLYLLKDKTVSLEVEKYGFKKEQFDYSFKKKSDGDDTSLQPLDFAVENDSGVPLYVVCFVYHSKEKRDQFNPWHYDKDEAVRLEVGETKIIPVPKVYNNYNRIYMQGVLTIFQEDEGQLAQDSTYELTDNDRKLKLGRLIDLGEKKVVIGIEKYGIVGDYIDYVVKPVRRIQFGPKT